MKDLDECDASKTNKILLYYISNKITDKSNQYTITKKNTKVGISKQNTSMKLGRLFNHVIITKI